MSSATRVPLASLWSLLLPLLAPAAANADQFGVASFQAPAGWTRKEQGDALIFESGQAGSDSYCQMLLSKVSKATVPLTQELERAWSETQVDAPIVGGPDTVAPMDVGRGRTLASRTALIQSPRGVFNTRVSLLQSGDRFVWLSGIASGGPADWERCANAQAELLEGMTLDTSVPFQQPAPAWTPNQSVTPSAYRAPQGLPDPDLAARFHNSVVGSWDYTWRLVWNGSASLPVVTHLSFERNGNYYISRNDRDETESGTYRVDGSHILMRPANGGSGGYVLDWYFGTHPQYSANKGLILTSAGDWYVGNGNRSFTFDPRP